LVKSVRVRVSPPAQKNLVGSLPATLERSDGRRGVPTPAQIKTNLIWFVFFFVKHLKK